MARRGRITETAADRQRALPVGPYAPAPGAPEVINLKDDCGEDDGPDGQSAVTEKDQMAGPVGARLPPSL